MFIRNLIQYLSNKINSIPKTKMIYWISVIYCLCLFINYAILHQPMSFSMKFVGVGLGLFTVIAVSQRLINKKETSDTDDDTDVFIP